MNPGTHISKMVSRTKSIKMNDHERLKAKFDEYKKEIYQELSKLKEIFL